MKYFMMLITFVNFTQIVHGMDAPQPQAAPDIFAAVKEEICSHDSWFLLQLESTALSRNELLKKRADQIKIATEYAGLFGSSAALGRFDIGLCSMVTVPKVPFPTPGQTTSLIEIVMWNIANIETILIVSPLFTTQPDMQLVTNLVKARLIDLLIIKTIFEQDNNSSVKMVNRGSLLDRLKSATTAWPPKHLSIACGPSAFSVLEQVFKQREINGTDNKDDDIEGWQELWSCKRVKKNEESKAQ